MKNELNDYMNLYQLQAAIVSAKLGFLTTDAQYLKKLEEALAYAAWHQMADGFRNKHTG